MRSEQITTTTLHQITGHWLQGIDNKMMVGAIFFDLTASFDVLDQNILLK